MDAQIVLGLIGSTLSIAGMSTSYIIMVRKHRKENEIIKKKEQAQLEARKKAEKERFYLTAAANLVVSADKLELTGPQKKEYVMTWLENEAIKAGIDVDKAVMSVAIERTILVLNDFKDKGKPVSQLLSEELDLSIAREQSLISEDVLKAQENLNRQTTKLQEDTKRGIAVTGKTIANVQEILK